MHKVVAALLDGGVLRFDAKAGQSASASASSAEATGDEDTEMTSFSSGGSSSGHAQASDETENKADAKTDQSQQSAVVDIEALPPHAQCLLGPRWGDWYHRCTTTNVPCEHFKRPGNAPQYEFTMAFLCACALPQMQASLFGHHGPSEVREGRDHAATVRVLLERAGHLPPASSSENKHGPVAGFSLSRFVLAQGLCASLERVVPYEVSSLVPFAVSF